MPRRLAGTVDDPDTQPWPDCAPPQRVMIIGGAGSGKSTAARMIGEALDLPVFYIDREVHWLPGWVERARAEKMPIIEAIVAQERWVFEGGHSESYDRRAARAELLIWLDIPVWLRIYRVVLRALRYNGRSRPDMADDCDEQITRLPEFLRFILRTRRPSRAKKAALYAKSDLPKRRFSRTADFNRFLAGFAELGGQAPPASAALRGAAGPGG